MVVVQRMLEFSLIANAVVGQTFTLSTAFSSRVISLPQSKHKIKEN